MAHVIPHDVYKQHSVLTYRRANGWIVEVRVGLCLGHGADAVVQVGGGGRCAEGASRGVVVRRTTVGTGSAASEL